MIYKLEAENMKTKEDIADNIIKKHYETMNWDEGCIKTLRKNIVDGLGKYAKQQINLSLGDVTNSTLRKCCENPFINEIGSQNLDCDRDYESCTVTYCVNCRQTLKIEP